MRRASQKVREQLDSMIRFQYLSKIFAGSKFGLTMRGGRYVVPVESGISRGSAWIGALIPSSQQAPTLFIVPMSVVEANNEILRYCNQKKKMKLNEY